MVGFTKKNVRTMTLGEKLKNLRSERRISLGEVSRSTRIQLKYLEYLEAGDYTKLPADVYVKGFLRGYAEFLGLDESILIRLYEKEKGIKRNLEKNKNNKKDKKELINIAPFLITPKIILVTLGACLVFGGFLYLYKEVGAFANTPKLVIINPEQNAVEDGNSVVIEGVTDRDAKVFINNQPVLVSDDGRFNQNLALQFGINIISVKTVNRFDKSNVQNITVQSNYRMAQDENEKQDGTNVENNIALLQSKISLDLKVDPGPVWVSVEADGNLVFSGTMLSGAMQSFSADEKIVISSGKANATYIKFNGKDIGVLDQKKDMIHGVVFTKDTKY